MHYRYKSQLSTSSCASIQYLATTSSGLPWHQSLFKGLAHHTQGGPTHPHTQEHTQRNNPARPTHHTPQRWHKPRRGAAGTPGPGIAASPAPATRVFPLLSLSPPPSSSHDCTAGDSFSLPQAGAGRENAAGKGGVWMLRGLQTSAWHGLGRLLTHSINTQDNPLTAQHTHTHTQVAPLGATTRRHCLTATTDNEHMQHT